jgi:hypothetical protein
MVFLIEYARSERRIVWIREFQDGQRPEAENARLELELRLNREGVDHEIVLLDASSEQALRRTHGRYFDEIEWPERDLPERVGNAPDA